MMGAMALGDYAWAYENLLNHILKGQLPVSKDLTTLIDTSAQSLQKQQSDFLEKNHLDEHLQQQLNQAEYYLNPSYASDSTEAAPIPIEPIAAQNHSSPASQVHKPDHKPDHKSEHDDHHAETKRINKTDDNSRNQEREDPSAKVAKPIIKAKSIQESQHDKDEKTNQVILSLFKNDLPELLEEIDSSMLAIQKQPEEQKKLYCLRTRLAYLERGRTDGQCTIFSRYFP